MVREWEKELRKFRNGKQPSLLMAILRVWGFYYFFLTFLFSVVVQKTFYEDKRKARHF